LAKQNAADHAVIDRIRFVESDLFHAIDRTQIFDIIASNPPYVSEAEYAKLSPTVRDFEPRSALVAGPRGTEVVERLALEAFERLKPGGWLLVEISPMIEAAARQLISQHGGYELGPTLKDAAGLPRILQAKKLAD